MVDTAVKGSSGLRGGATRGARYKLMLVTAALIWGGSFVVLKTSLDVLTPSWLLGIRFVLSGLVMTLLFFRHMKPYLNRSHLLAGAWLGLSGGLAYLIQNLGLVDTTPGHNAFLTATYCVMVPFMHWIVTRKRPSLANVAAAIMAVVGIGVLSLGGSDPFSLRWGDWMTLGGAVWFAVQIEVMVAVAPGRDVLTMTVVEFFVMGFVNLAYALLFEPVPALSTFASLELWAQLAYLVLLSSCVCTLFQNIGQAHVPPAQASLLLSLESVFGVAFSVLLYGEPLTLQLAGGFALVFGAILLSELAPARKKSLPQA
ncbi:MAG: DMT family transporter [Coriobacteriales bacterium]|nr:DMT family transporter [Coriobacteriales bacterium]